MKKWGVNSPEKVLQSAVMPRFYVVLYIHKYKGYAKTFAESANVGDIFVITRGNR